MSHSRHVLADRLQNLKETTYSLEITDRQIQELLLHEDWEKFHIKHQEQYLHMHLATRVAP